MVQEHNFTIDKLTLITGQALVVGSPPIMLYQPSLKELGVLGQMNFYSAIMLLTYPKRIVKTEDDYLKDAADFEIIMSIFRKDDDTCRLYTQLISLLLSLVLKHYTIKIAGNMILLERENEKQIILNAENYDFVKQALIQMFCLKDIMGDDSNEIKDTDTPMVRRLKEKFKKRHEILARKNGGKGENDLLARYISIVATGLGLPLIQINEYTIYQLFDEYKRFQLKEAFDLYIKRATSFGGVKKEEKVVNWQKSLEDTSDD